MYRIECIYVYLQQKAGMIKKEAEELTIPEDNVTEPVLEATSQLSDYKIVAEVQGQSIEVALNKTKEAGEAAKEARNKIQDVLEKLKALLADIDGLDNVNMSRLNNLEEQLQNDTETERQLDREVLAVEQQRQFINESITRYTIDMNKYRAEKKLLQEMYEKLPKICPRVTPEPET